jgi:hypothetical protein
MLSGLSFVGDNNLASIMRTMIASRKMSGFAGCSLLGGVFGAISKAQEFIADMQFIAQCLQKLAVSLLNDIQSIVSFISSFPARLLNEIANNLQSYLQGQLALLIDSLSSGISDFFDDECFGEIFGLIATDKTRNATNIIKSAKQ